MPLTQRLPETGRWLFRWRSFLPVIIVVAALVAMFPLPALQHDSFPAECVEMIALLVTFSGFLLRCWTIGHTPAGTSGRNSSEQIAITLNTTGIYSTVRHPLYFANFLFGLGLAAYTLNLWFVVIYVLAFWLYYERIMMAEEQFLREMFGETFDLWAEKTPAFFPRLSNYVPAALPFSFRNVLKREYNAVLQIAVVTSLLEFMGDRIDTGHFSTSLPWLVFLIAGCMIWVILRTLKRHTRILHVEGR